MHGWLPLRRSAAIERPGGVAPASKGLMSPDHDYAQTLFIHGPSHPSKFLGKESPIGIAYDDVVVIFDHVRIGSEDLGM